MKQFLLLAAYTLMISHAYGQHRHNREHKEQEHKEHPKPTTPAKPKPAAPAKPTKPAEHADHAGQAKKAADTLRVESPMSHAFSRNLPMNRNGSGTSWLPDSTPMYGYMLHTPKWMFMAHGNLFIRYNKQDLFDKGLRGGEEWDAPNWLMFMGQRNVGRRGLFHFNTMISLDNFFGGNGYPLLFQTGETWQGKPLVDRQHPHDLFSELSVSYAHSFNTKTDAFIYVGYPGEPAIGSTAFMHRVSSLYNPDAPLSHHWNDGTHITFGVVTLGFRYADWKLEASTFKGREPDENRYNLDRFELDSYSGRLSYSPSSNWTLQASRAFVKSPEILHPEEDVNRTTASAIYSMPFGGERFLNATALWGVNAVPRHTREHTALLEASMAYPKWTLYGRYEWIQKSAEELYLDDFEDETIFWINALTLGSSYNLLYSSYLNMALGGQLSFFYADQRLDSLYGQYPVSAEVYLRIFPPRMMMGQKHKGHHMKPGMKM